VHFLGGLLVFEFQAMPKKPPALAGCVPNDCDSVLQELLKKSHNFLMNELNKRFTEYGVMDL
jgi:hypothetical protein